jgi:hypothetical protein
MMAVIDSKENFFADQGCPLLREEAPVLNLIEQISPGTKLRDQIELSVILKHFEDSYNIWMRKSLKHVCLLDEFLPCFLCSLCLGDKLNSSLLTGSFVIALEYYSIASLS